jgi:hypothetical protein
MRAESALSQIIPSKQKFFLKYIFIFLVDLILEASHPAVPTQRLTDTLLLRTGVKNEPLNRNGTLDRGLDTQHGVFVILRMIEFSLLRPLLYFDSNFVITSQRALTSQSALTCA